MCIRDRETAAPNSDFPIVIELYLPRNRDVVQAVAPGRVFMVDAEEILAKVMVQTSRTTGLSVVYSELLSFDGCEMYFYEADWGGIEFGKCQFHFPDGVPIGIRNAEGEVVIRPALSTVLGAGAKFSLWLRTIPRSTFKSHLWQNRRTGH